MTIAQVRRRYFPQWWNKKYPKGSGSSPNRIEFVEYWWELLRRYLFWECGRKWQELVIDYMPPAIDANEIHRDLFGIKDFTQCAVISEKDYNDRGADPDDAPARDPYSQIDPRDGISVSSGSRCWDALDRQCYGIGAHGYNPPERTLKVLIDVRAPKSRVLKEIECELKEARRDDVRKLGVLLKRWPKQMGLNLPEDQWVIDQQIQDSTKTLRLNEKIGRHSKPRWGEIIAWDQHQPRNVSEVTPIRKEARELTQDFFGKHNKTGEKATLTEYGWVIANIRENYGLPGKPEFPDPGSPQHDVLKADSRAAIGLK